MRTPNAASTPPPSHVPSDSPVHMLANPAWHALHTAHRRFAVCNGGACKYPADVTPFAAVVQNDVAALEQLRALMAPNERTNLIGPFPPPTPGLTLEHTIEGLQMVFPEEAPLPAAPLPASPLEPMGIVPLSCADAPAMVELTDLAFPGFFRIRTCEMGPYYGVRLDGKLIAMAGERIALDGYREISGVCTHPAHTGKGYAAALIAQLLRDHRRDRIQSYLHVAGANGRAMALYRRLGFIVSRETRFMRIARTG